MGEQLLILGVTPSLSFHSALDARTHVLRSFAGLFSSNDRGEMSVCPGRSIAPGAGYHNSFPCICPLRKHVFPKQRLHSKGLKFPSHQRDKGRSVVRSELVPWWREVLLERLSKEDFIISGGDVYDFSNSEDGDNNRDSYSEDLLDVDRMLSDDFGYFSRQQKASASDELQDDQETDLDPDRDDDWKDWLDVTLNKYSPCVGSRDRGWYSAQSEWETRGVPREAPKKPERGMSRTIKELFFRIFETQEEVENDLDFEEKAKFSTILILVPWVVNLLVHDFVVVPFLRRWVEEVPLAEKILDVRESQKLYMIERLKLERQRVRFESEIGKTPPLSDEQLNEHIHKEALGLREDLREENRMTFANIWSDAVAGFTILSLLIANPEQVSIMRMTGDRLFTNISDTGKAFIIILCSDIFLGYHSESGWETVIEALLDHYGLEASQPSIYTFVAVVPVTIDACFKLWVFRHLTRLSPSAAATFREMKRH